MATIVTQEINDKNIWEEFLSRHPECNFLQSWNWGEFHLSLKKEIVRTGFYDGDNLLGVMLSVVEPAKRGRYLTVPAGPIIDWQNKDIVNAFKNEIVKIAKDKKCVFVRVRPQLITNDFSINLFGDLGFKDAPTHLHAELTSQLDITKPEEELMANMRKATRYEVRKAINTGITIDASDNPDQIKDFYDLQLETAKRQKFVPFSYEFLHEQFKVFANDNKAILYTAKFEGKTLAQAFIIFYGQEAAYHYGASTDLGRRYPGAYLIQWEAIREAKRRGMTRYNFWGVAPLDDSDHRFAGLSLFKRGFGGQDVDYLHARDLVIDKMRYTLNFAIEKTRKIIRHV